MFGYLRGGIYRRELAALLLLSEDPPVQTRRGLPKTDGFGELAKKQSRRHGNFRRRRS